jgi:hypothetical protein
MGERIMKKLISYLIIHGLVLQFFNGCHSAKYITKDELRNYAKDNDVIIKTNDNKEYTLTRDSAYQYYSNWVYVDDKIELTESKLIQQKDKNSKQLVTTKTEINENEIANIGLEEFDGLKTLLLSVGILAVIVIIGLLTTDDFIWGGEEHPLK